MVEHRQEFQRELDAIEAKVIELFAMVAEDLPRATEALLSGNTDTLRALTEREQMVDALYPEIEELANREIVLQAPVASDLRFLLSVLRIVPELERSHDLVIDIAHRANHSLSRGSLAAQPGARRGDGATGVGHVARGSGLLVPARPHRGEGAAGPGRGDG